MKLSFKRHKHLKKGKSLYSWLAVGSIVVLAGLAALTITLNAKHAEAAWFNTNWAYRKAIPITAHTSAETNVYISVTLDTSDSSKFQPDCGDLRFTQNNGKLLSYYIVSSCTSTTTVVHVFLPSFPAGAQTFYYYYANPSASNGFKSGDFSTQANNYTLGTIGSEEQAPGPIEYWKFDDGSGSTAKDATASDNDVTLGASTASPSWQSDNQCIAGKCLLFDGNNDYAVTSSSINLSNTNAITVEFWMKWTSFANNDKLAMELSTNYNNVTTGFLVDPNRSTNNLFQIGVFGDGGYNTSEFTRPSANIWHHYAFVFNKGNPAATEVVPYVDGVPVNYSKENSGNNTNNFGNLPLYFMSRAGASLFGNGFMDEARVYTYARSSTQILSDYNSRASQLSAANVLGINVQNKFNALSNGLVGYWKMDESSWNGTSGEVKDASGNGNDGQAINYFKGTSSGSNSSTTLNLQSSTVVTANILTNATITITSGTDVGDVRTIASNTTTQVTVSSAWTTTPDATSVYNITSSTTPSTAGGKFGSAGSFNGQSQGVSIPTNTSLNVQTGNFTASAWFNASTNSGIQTTEIFGKDCCGNAGNWYIGWVSGGHVRFNFASVNIQDSFSAMNPNTWHQAVVVVSGSTMSLYVDGKFAASGIVPSGSQITTLMPVGIGYGTIQTSGTQQGKSYFNGSVDEARLYNRALSAQDVEDLYAYAPGPVAYYNFEEGQGTALNDRSGNGFTGTWSGGVPYWSAGKYGKAGTFNGTDDVVNVGDISSKLNLSSLTPPSFTESAWMNVSSCPSGGVGGVAGVQLMPSRVRLYCNGGSPANFVFQLVAASTTATSTTTISNGTWYYVTGVYDSASNKMSLYINGNLEASATPASTDLSGVSMNMKIGFAQLYFNGKIDEVKVYNYALTQKQIVSDMNGGGASTSAGSGKVGAVGYWKFDEGADNKCNGGTNDVCNSGNGGSGLDGAENNMAVPATVGISGWQQSGKFGKALAFDGSNDYVSMGNPTAAQIASSAAITAWINLNSNTVNQDIMAKVGSGANKFAYRLWVTSSGKLKFDLSQDGNVVATGSGSTTLSKNKWYFVAGSYNPGQDISVYVNGNQDGQTTSSVPASIYNPNSTNVLIGAENSGATNNFNGLIDEVKLYSYSLSRQGIRLDMNKNAMMQFGSFGLSTSDGKTASNSAGATYCVPGDTSFCSPPIAEWNFEEKQGSSINDTSGNANTGTWNGTAPYWTQGKVGTGGIFNGSDAYVSVTSILSGIESVSFWVYPSATTNYFIDFDSGTHVISASLGTISVTGFTSPTIYVNGIVTSLITANKWQYVTVTTATPFNSTNPLTIGKVISSGSKFFSGKIDQVRIYNYLRSSAQEAYDYNRGAPIAWLKLDDCQGMNVIDSSGNGYAGTVSLDSGNALGTCSTSSTFWGGSGGTGVGKFNYAPTFDGVDDKITVGTISNVQSISFWVKPATSSAALLQIASGKDVYGSSSTVSTDGITTPTIYVNGIRNGTLNASSWNHIVITTTAAITADSIQLAQMQRGVLSGQLDDVRFYNYALTAYQMQNLYNGGAALRFGPATGAP